MLQPYQPCCQECEKTVTKENVEVIANELKKRTELPVNKKIPPEILIPHTGPKNSQLCKGDSFYLDMHPRGQLAKYNRLRVPPRAGKVLTHLVQIIQYEQFSGPFTGQSNNGYPVTQQQLRDIIRNGKICLRTEEQRNYVAQNLLKCRPGELNRYLENPPSTQEMLQKPWLKTPYMWLSHLIRWTRIAYEKSLRQRDRSWLLTSLKSTAIKCSKAGQKR